MESNLKESTEPFISVDLPRCPYNSIEHKVYKLDNMCMTFQARQTNKAYPKLCNCSQSWLVLLCVFSMNVCGELLDQLFMFVGEYFIFGKMLKLR